MVLINDKKFACATCIKGHRVSGCTHTDRALFEVKKKGRPTTQCACCREKRKGSVSSGSGNGAVHNKCICGGEAKEKEKHKDKDRSTSSSTLNLPEPFLPLPPGSEASYATSTSGSDHSPTPTPHNGFTDSYETRKGVPGSNATFPNGLKDVHDMAAAAEALSGMGGDDVVQVAERKVANLLNPCHCKSGGICKCCLPKREKPTTLPLRAVSPSLSQSSGALTPTRTHSKSVGHTQVTDSLIEMFKSKATTSSTPPELHHPNIYQGYHSSNNHSNVSTLFLSPDNMHHPAHTSPHVHKTKLYSPYSTSGHASPRHAHGLARRDSTTPRSGWASTHHAKSPPPPRIRPLADMNTFLGAVFKEDGTLASEIPRSALGLPGIKAFDQPAQSGAAGGVDAAIFKDDEGMNMEVDVPVSFPTTQDVVIGACTCGDDCECAGCATHPTTRAHTTQSSGVNAMDGMEGNNHACGENCKSCFNCADHLSLPSGITSIQHLLSLAAANVPLPHPVRALGPGQLNAHDTRVLPPAIGVSEEARLNMGLVVLKPLECCNGRCQCKAGECTCEKTCCGCCVRCACDEDGDGDERMGGGVSGGGNGNGVSGVVGQNGNCVKSVGEVTGDCCKDKTGNGVPKGIYTPTVLISPTVEVDQSEGLTTSISGQIAHSNLPRTATSTTTKESRHTTSKTSSGSITPNRQELPPSASSTLRRAGSITHGPPNARRTSGTSVQRSASTGKSASKALALHQAPHHPQIHHRPILPKPPSNPSVGAHGVGVGNGGAEGLLPPGGGARANSSKSSSRTASPALPGYAANTIAQPALTNMTNMNGYGINGSNGNNTTMAQLIPDFSQHSFFANEHDYILPPGSSSSAPPSVMEMAEDENLDVMSLAENGDFMAYLASIGLGGDTVIPMPDLGGGEGTEREGTDAVFGASGSGDGIGSTMGNGDEAGKEFYELLARAMASQQHAGVDQGGDEASANGGVGAVGGVQALGAGLGESVDYGWSFSPFDYRAAGRSGSNTPSSTGIPAMNATSTTATTTATTNQIPGQQGHYTTHDPSRPHSHSSILPQTQSTISPQTQFTTTQSQPHSSQTHTLSSNGPDPSPRPAIPPLQALQQVLNNGISGSANPNLIDLSKPLDADDVERIIRALQAQQSVLPKGQPTLSTLQHPQESTAGNGLVTQRQSVQNHSANGDHQGQRQTTNGSQPTFQGQYPLNTQGFSQTADGVDRLGGNPQTFQTYANSSSTQQSSYPPSDASSQHVPLSSASTTGDMDEMFDRFVFDPNLLSDATGEGFDNLDNQDQGLFGGEGIEDWARQFGVGVEGESSGKRGDEGLIRGWKEGEVQSELMEDFLRSTTGI